MLLYSTAFVRQPFENLNGPRRATAIDAFNALGVDTTPSKSKHISRANPFGRCKIPLKIPTGVEVQRRGDEQYHHSYTTARTENAFFGGAREEFVHVGIPSALIRYGGIETTGWARIHVLKRIHIVGGANQ